MVIVAAVDRSDRAQTVVEEAGTLAVAFDEPVRVVHALTPSEFTQLERTSVEETGRPKSMDEVRTIATNIAREPMAEAGERFEAIGLIGDPADAVVDYAASNDARYVVTAGRKRSPAGKAIFGSVAQSIVVNATVPVVVTIEDD